MLYAVLLEDEPSRMTMRMKHMSEHLPFLERYAHSIRAAGPLVDAVHESGAGGLWLVEAENLQRVQALCQSGPVLGDRAAQIRSGAAMEPSLR